MTEPYFSGRLAPLIHLSVSILVLLIVLVLWGHAIWLAASPFLIALVLAYMLHPVALFLQRRCCRGRRLPSVILLYALVLVVVIPIVAILIVGVVGELVGLYNNLPAYWENVKSIGSAILDHLPPLPETFVSRIRSARDELDRILRDPEKLRQFWEETLAPMLAPQAAASGDTPTVQEVVREVSETGVGRRVTDGVGGVISGMTATVQYIVGKVIGWMGGAVAFTTNLILVVVILFYFLLDFEKLGMAIPKFIPPGAREGFLRIWGAIDRQLAGFLRGQITVAICVGILSAILYTIAGVDSGILIGLFAGACNIIPYLGPIMGLIPAVGSTVVEQYAFGFWAVVWQLFWVGIVYATVQMLEGLVISPRVMSEAVDLHPMVILFALMLGGSLGGILGMLIAVPAACVVRVLVQELYLKPMENTTNP